MAETNYVTQETFDKMQQELHLLKTIDRPAASKAIAEAREKGDLKENAEYDAAKERLDAAQARINILCREYSLATRTYAFKDYMLRKELYSFQGRRRA